MTRKPVYTVLIKRSAEKEMDRLPAAHFDRIARAILRLETEPRPRGSKRLRGMTANRIRAGDYRILYSVDDNKRIVEVIAVGHRREVYRDI